MNENMKTVDYEVINEVCRIFLNRPGSLNAVVPQLVEDLCQALDRAESDNVKTVILSGRGRAFCAGHDLKSSENEREESEIERRIRFQRIQDVTRKIRQAPYPIIAAVQGYALGAGCEFALCCDLVIAEEEAQFGFPEVSVGLSVTGGISHILPNSIGLVKSKELLFLGERFTAKEAKNLGLINFVVDPGNLEHAAMELGLKLSKLPQSALSRAKIILNSGSQTTIDNAYEMEIEHVVSTTVSADAKSEAKKFRSK